MDFYLNEQWVSSSVWNEFGVSRLNIRIIATNKENINTIELMLKAAGITDIDVVLFKNLEQYSWGKIGWVFKECTKCQTWDLN